MDEVTDVADSAACVLLGGIFALFLQGMLAFAAFTTLFYKRMIEQPKRELKIWFFDVSKQGFGSLSLHCWNVALSIFIAKYRDESAGDECSIYFIQFVVDTVAGTFLIWLSIKMQTFIAKKVGIQCLQESGYYGTPPRLHIYFAQLFSYLFIILLVKTVLSFSIIIFDAQLEAIAAFLFGPVKNYPDIELTLVMIIFPWILNSVQFWVLDTIVMDREHDLDDSNEYNYKRIDGSP